MYARQFTLVHVVNFSTLFKENSKTEVHYGVPWHLNVRKRNHGLAVHLHCQKVADANNPWSIDTNVKFILASDQQTQREANYQFTKEERLGFSNLDSVDNVTSNYLVDGFLTVTCHVTIKRMDGFPLKRKIDFEEAKESWTDGVLKVDEKTFNVNKRLLAYRSPYFDTLFFGNFSESSSSEIELKEVNPDHFQRLLEVIYGESSVIQMENVEGVLTLADEFNVKYVREKCIEILGQDGTDNQFRFTVADKFDLKELMEKLLQSITSAEELRQLSPTDPSVLKPATVLALYKKSLSFHPQTGSLPKRTRNL